MVEAGGLFSKPRKEDEVEVPLFFVAVGDESVVVTASAPPPLSPDVIDLLLHARQH